MRHHAQLLEMLHWAASALPESKAEEAPEAQKAYRTVRQQQKQRLRDGLTILFLNVLVCFPPTHLNLHRKAKHRDQ